MNINIEIQQNFKILLHVIKAEICSCYSYRLVWIGSFALNWATDVIYVFHPYYKKRL